MSACPTRSYARATVRTLHVMNATHVLRALVRATIDDDRAARVIDNDRVGTRVGTRAAVLVATHAALAVVAKAAQVKHEWRGQVTHEELQRRKMQCLSMASQDKNKIS